MEVTRSDVENGTENFRRSRESGIRYFKSIEIYCWLYCITWPMIALTSDTCLAMTYYHILSNKVRFSETWFEIKFLFRFSLKSLSQTFIVRRNWRGIITSLYTFSCKVHFTLQDLKKKKLGLSQQIFERYSSKNFQKKISSFWAEFLHADNHTVHIHDAANSCFFFFLQIYEPA